MYSLSSAQFPLCELIADEQFAHPHLPSLVVLIKIYILSFLRL